MKNVKVFCPLEGVNITYKSEMGASLNNRLNIFPLITEQAIMPMTQNMGDCSDNKAKAKC